MSNVYVSYERMYLQVCVMAGDDTSNTAPQVIGLRASPNDIQSMYDMLNGCIKRLSVAYDGECMEDFYRMTENVWIGNGGITQVVVSSSYRTIYLYVAGQALALCLNDLIKIVEGLVEVLYSL